VTSTGAGHTGTAVRADDSAARSGWAARLTTAVDTGRAYRWLLLIAGVVGGIGSTVLTLDEIKLLKNPDYVPSCSINPVISCGSVMKSDQAHAFGFPNPLLGLVCFAVVVTLAVVVLAGARLPGWVWLGLQAGTLFGAGFITWLMDQTLYSIGALCPYCIAVWLATIALFWYTLLHNVRHGVIPAPAWARAFANSWYHWVVPALWYFVIAMLILNRFWYYWRTLI
jgi:uncharacterized membrane protein